MKNYLFAAAVLAGMSQLSAIASPDDGSLNSQLYTGCPAEELGKVTGAKVLDAKQVNAYYKKLNAPQNAKLGEIYLKLEMKLASGPRDTSVSLLKTKPTETAVKALVGKPTCVVIAQD